MIAYNKMDLADSSDYLEEIQEYMQEQGLDPRDVVAISAVTGRGVLDLVRRVRQVLDSLGEEVCSLCPAGPVLAVSYRKGRATN